MMAHRDRSCHRWICEEQCARAQTAEALAAEYRALAAHPPSAPIATHYLYDPAGRLLGEYDEAAQAEREYVYLEGMPLALMAPSGIYYYHTDHLGTPESLTDQDEAIVWQAHHDPFGRASVTTQAVVNNLRFPGQYFEAEAGLHYNYFRDYDPSIGRYIQSDPIGLAGGINTYAVRWGKSAELHRPRGVAVDCRVCEPCECAALCSCWHWASSRRHYGRCSNVNPWRYDFAEH